MLNACLCFDASIPEGQRRTTAAAVQDPPTTTAQQRCSRSKNLACARFDSYGASGVTSSNSSLLNNSQQIHCCGWLFYCGQNTKPTPSSTSYHIIVTASRTWYLVSSSAAVDGCSSAVVGVPLPLLFYDCFGYCRYNCRRTAMILLLTISHVRPFAVQMPHITTVVYMYYHSIAVYAYDAVYTSTEKLYELPLALLLMLAIISDKLSELNSNRRFPTHRRPCGQTVFV